MGFPSPLLDWTSSPYVAAYFAFQGAIDTNPAVFCYIEHPKLIKVGSVSEPMITVKGPFVKTHRRHFSQQASYTIATKWNNISEQHIFCPHESVFDNGYDKQDILVKIEMSNSFRTEAFERLNEYNINHFTLFGSEDALVKMLAMQKFRTL